MESFQNNPEKSFTEKEWSIHLLAIHFFHTNSSSDAAKPNFDCYRGKDCREKFCGDLREHAVRIVYFEKKEMIALTDEENKSGEKQNVCYICKKKIWNQWLWWW